jgi:hypothetical protein
MAVFPGSYVPIGLSTTSRINYIVDTYLTPRLLAFRQVTIFDEPALLMPDGVTWQVHYGNWNPTYPLVCHKNKAMIPTPQIVNIDYAHATFQFGSVTTGDTCNLTYSIDYFGIATLEGFIRQAVDFINTNAFGPATNYTINDAPQYWDGVLADLAFALCIEKLLLEYDLWYGRLIFAIGAQALEDGGGDITGALDTLKQNAEERANQAITNEKFKIPPTLAKPTVFYYQAIRGFGRSGVHNVQGYGKLRGWKPTKYL